MSVINDKVELKARVGAATYLSAIEVVAGIINHLSGQDISGATPNGGSLRDDFGREIIGGRIQAEIKNRGV